MVKKHQDDISRDVILEDDFLPDDFLEFKQLSRFSAFPAVVFNPSQKKTGTYRYPLTHLMCKLISGA